MIKRIVLFVVLATVVQAGRAPDEAPNLPDGVSDKHRRHPSLRFFNLCRLPVHESLHFSGVLLQPAWQQLPLEVRLQSIGNMRFTGAFPPFVHRLIGRCCIP